MTCVMFRDLFRKSWSEWQRTLTDSVSIDKKADPLVLPSHLHLNQKEAYRAERIVDCSCPISREVDR